MRWSRTSASRPTAAGSSSAPTCTARPTSMRSRWTGRSESGPADEPCRWEEMPSMRTDTLSAGVLSASLLALGAFTAAAPAGDIPSFPGADGAGASATGGRGGVVYHVTRLDGEVDG